MTSAGAPMAYLASSGLAFAPSTTRRTPSPSGTDGRQSQVRRAAAASRQIRDMSPRRSGARVGSCVYPVGRHFAKQLDVRDLPSPPDIGDDTRGSGGRPNGRLHDVAHVHVVAGLPAVAEDRH